jgi:very-short-patch-repair endonuclease
METELYAQVARRQHGAVARQQLRGLGFGDHQIDHMVRLGRLRRLHRGVYATAGSPSTYRQRLWAACLCTTPPAVVSHRAAALLHGFRVKGEADSIEVTVVRERRPRVVDVVVHQSRDLHPTQVSTLEGLPVTNPTRVLVDLGQVVPWWEVEQALECFLRTGLVTIPQVRAARELHGVHGRRGAGVLGRVLDERALRDAVADSPLEALVAKLCRDAGLGGLEFQHEVRLNGRTRRIDFAIPALKLAIEIDGYEFHSGRAQFEADRIRGNELALAGWHVLHFTWHQVVHRPEYVLATIRRAVLR